MATKSITKDVRITNRSLGLNFVNALDNCANKGSVKVTIPNKVREMKSAEEIQKLFGKA